MVSLVFRVPFIICGVQYVRVLESIKKSFVISRCLEFINSLTPISNLFELINSIKMLTYNLSIVSYFYSTKQ